MMSFGTIGNVSNLPNMANNVTTNGGNDGLTNTISNGIGGLNAHYVSNLLVHISSGGASGSATSGT